MIKRGSKIAVSKLDFAIIFVSCFLVLFAVQQLQSVLWKNISNSRKPHPPIWSVLELHGDLMHTQMRFNS